MSALPASRLGSSPGAAVPGRSAIRLSLCALLLATLTLAACERSDSVQRGYRGTGILNVYDASKVTAALPEHAIPEPEEEEEEEPDGPTINEVFQNVQVLGDLGVLQFSRLMQAMSTWIAPEEGCEFCHNPRNLASDEKYPKVVARQMLQMTRQINTEWKSHVADTGVTCWTCHRGQAVPSGDWFTRVAPGVQNFIGNRHGQNMAGVASNGNTSLPFDALSAYLMRDESIRVQGEGALPAQPGTSVKQAEWTYSLMIYMSNSLGVNCTYCHNTRALARWDQSSPQRSVAWYGIRLVRQLNTQYLEPVGKLLPAHRLSAEGDWPKVGCETCHKGAFKPMYGQSMLDDYPELRGVLARPGGRELAASAVQAEPAPAVAAAAAPR
jgi:photosynthetic reaction center cytochrome c subunit